MKNKSGEELVENEELKRTEANKSGEELVWNPSDAKDKWRLPKILISLKVSSQVFGAAVNRQLRQGSPITTTATVVHFLSLTHRRNREATIRYVILDLWNFTGNRIFCLLLYEGLTRWD